MTVPVVRPHTIQVQVDGVDLTITQIGDSVTVSRVIGRDRKRMVDITNGVTFVLEGPLTSIMVVRNLRKVAKLRTLPCKCDYRIGYSGHAEHCESIYVASCEHYGHDDD